MTSNYFVSFLTGKMSGLYTKKMKQKFIKNNPGHAGLIIDALNDNNVKKNKIKAILNKEGQMAKAYFLYYSVSKL
ncbi:MAG: hypothetical protein ACYSTS_18190 [Planctomycetota bacterium]|jgi:hypothetical protein